MFLLILTFTTKSRCRLVECLHYTFKYKYSSQQNLYYIINRKFLIKVFFMIKPMMRLVIESIIKFVMSIVNSGIDFGSNTKKKTFFIFRVNSGFTHCIGAIFFNTCYYHPQHILQKSLFTKFDTSSAFCTTLIFNHTVASNSRKK